MKHVAIPLFLALLGAWAVGAAVADTGPAAGDRAKELLQKSVRENTGELERLRGEIKSHRERMGSLDSEEAEVRRSHEDIQKEIELTHQLLGEMVQRELILSQQSELLEKELAVSIKHYQARREALARGLRNMYLKQQRTDLEMVLTADSFTELVSRAKVGRMLARLEAGLLEDVRSQGAAIHKEQRMLNAALAEIWETREEKTRENDRLEMLMAEQMGALRDLETERKEIKSKLVQLGLNEQKLAYILSDLEQQRVERDARQEAGSAPIAGLAGQMEWPVRGELLRGFGRSVHPRFKTVTLNNGYNIAAPVGSPVAAVADGTVEFSDDLPGFGQCVILDHGAGYYTLYAYLERVFVAKGEEIARGQVVAEVGRPSGGDDPQLYFEVRQGRTPLDPADWLRSR